MPFSAKRQHAPLWKRILAYVVDAMIIAVLLSPLPSIRITNFILDMAIVRSLLTVFLVGSILAVLYFALLEFYVGQTIGKLVFSLAIASEGKALNFSQVLLRNVPKFSSLLLIIDSLPIILGRSHQRFFERISHTEVVQWER